MGLRSLLLGARLLVAVAAMAAPEPVRAEEEWALAGRVVDARNGAPIAGASVVVEATPFGAVSGADGGFRVTGLSDGVYRLRVRHVAYRSASKAALRVRGGRGPRLHFELEPRVHKVQGVVVRERREPVGGAVAAPEAGSVVTHLTGPEIRALGATHLGEALVFAPGVQVERARAGGAVRASIRGSGAQRVLVLVDGMPINDPATGEADLREVAVHSIDRIEVRSGAMAAAMGHGGAGGVISVVTEAPLAGVGADAEREAAALRGRVGTGDFGWRRVEAALGGDLGRVRVDLDAVDARHEGDLPVAEPTYPYARIPNGDWRERSLRVGAGRFWPAGETELRATAWWREAEGGAPGTLEFVTPEARARHSRGAAHLGLRHGSWEEGRIRLRLDLSASRAEQDYVSPAIQDGQPSFPARRESRAEIVRAEGRLVGGAAANRGRWSLAGWGEFDRHRDIDHLSPGRGVGERERREGGGDLGLLVRRPWGAAGTWIGSLQAGARVDRLFPGQWFFGPRVGIETEDSGGVWSLGAAASRSVRPPTLNDLFWSGDLNLSGNPDLRAELNHGVDGKGAWHLGGGWTAEARAWYSEIENLIQWQAGPALQWRPVNLPRARLSGGEGVLRWRGTRGIDLEGALTVQAAENRDPSDPNAFGRALVFRAERLAHLRAGWHRREGDGIDLACRFVGRQPTTAANTVYLEPHWLIDASGRVTLASGERWRLRLGVETRNLLDSSYQTAVDALPPGLELRCSVGIEGGMTRSMDGRGSSDE